MTLRKDDTATFQPSAGALAEHPLFSGKTTVGMISGENPRFQGQATGHEAVGQALKQMGLKAQPREGRYGAPERSWMVFGPTREQMYQLGQYFGQESVVYSEGGRHELLYTNGPNAGRYHPALDHEFFHQPPEDYFTHMPELGGYLRLNFDWDKLHPTNLGQTHAVDALGTRAQHAGNQPLEQPTMKSGDLKLALAATLRKALAEAGVEPPPHPLYPAVDEALAKKEGGKYWKSRDGIRIPLHGTPERERWNKSFYDQLVQVFAGGDPRRLRPLKVPVAGLTGYNMPVNKDRLSLYQRMAAAGDPLPPAIVRRSGRGYNLIDGNHRQAAAEAKGRQEMDAYELLDANDPSLKAPAEKPRRPAAKMQPSAR